MQVVQRRGGHVEALHPFSVAVVQDGRVVFEGGHPIRPPMRSSAKPFQLACCLDVLGDPELSSEELAVGTASHTAEERHVGLIRGLFKRFGVTEDDLLCGGHPPLYPPAWEQLVREGTPLSSIHNNCSGKHTFMVAASKRRGWTGDYRSPSHPLQRIIGERMAELADERPDVAIDGCGAPSWVIGLPGMARAWEQLARLEDPRLERVARAMMRHPPLTSGSGRLDLQVMEGRREEMVVKIGAQALFCMAFPQRRTGIAVKVQSGSEAALGEAVAWCLTELVPGAWERVDSWEWNVLRNVIGKSVGVLGVEEL